MLSLTRKTDYALLALAHLARCPGQTISAREISDMFGISQPLLTNVMKQLCSAGIICSTRGARGGYSLSKSADEIHLAEIISATEGPVQLAPCVKGTGTSDIVDSCARSESCPMQGPLMWLHYKLVDFFADISLAQLAASDSAAAANKEVSQ